MVSILVCLCIRGTTLPWAGADEFERLEGEVLAAVPRSKDATPQAQLTMGAIAALPSVLRDSRAALVVVTTDLGNYTRLLLSPGLRKPPGGAGEPVPVLVIDRFDTFDAGNVAARLARGRELVLFDGFRVDLDSGLVVPEDQGGDVRFLVAGEGGPRLEAVGKARLYTLATSPLASAPAGAQPAVGRAVLPGDFAGRYRLFANGQWSGTLDLKVDDDGGVSGRFRSDLNGAVYVVSGQVAAGVPHKVSFRIKFPRTQQEYEGFLWTEGKGALAGTVTMLDRAYGFFALREGGRFAPEGEDVGLLGKESQTGTPGRRVVVVRRGQYTLDGLPRTDQELTDALKQARVADPATWVLLQVPDDEPFAAIQRAFEVIGAAGVRSIRLAGAD
jgi:hypothetical protein